MRAREEFDRPAVDWFLTERHSAPRVARRGEVLYPLDHPALLTEADGKLTGVLTHHGHRRLRPNCASMSSLREGWRVAESNADAVRSLGAQRVVLAQTAEVVATAVGSRNVLVHEYVDVDDGQVCDNLERLGDVEAFVSQVAAWSGTS
ncbi:MAG: DUF86 domain-containing protein [Actinomycetota bacterium]|nr:DUF86 domain-containing protein [Actinomycetota bacterium]